MNEQLDLFADQDAEHREAERRRREDLQRAHTAAIAVDCCTGLPYPRGERRDEAGTVIGSWPQQRCGRCGELASIGAIMTSHDCGYCGCPGWDYISPGRQHVDITRGRHDDQHHAHCQCGHPWGLHGWPSQARELNSCLTHCGCRGYVEPTRDG